MDWASGGRNDRHYLGRMALPHSPQRTRTSAPRRKRKLLYRIFSANRHKAAGCSKNRDDVETAQLIPTLTNTDSPCSASCRASTPRNASQIKDVHDRTSSCRSRTASLGINHHRKRGAANMTRVRATTDRTIIHPFQVLRPGDPLPTEILMRCTSVLPPGNFTSNVSASTPTKSARERYKATNAGTCSAKHCL
jgi:hypothetical protein